MHIKWSSIKIPEAAVVPVADGNFFRWRVTHVFNILNVFIKDH